MTASVLLAAVTIAFPREGQRFGPLDRCYLIGAADGGETNVVVAGMNVPVYRTGAWGVLLDVAPGANSVSAGGVVIHSSTPSWPRPETVRPEAVRGAPPFTRS